MRFNLVYITVERNMAIKNRAKFRNKPISGERLVTFASDNTNKFCQPRPQGLLDVQNDVTEKALSVSINYYWPIKKPASILKQVAWERYNEHLRVSRYTPNELVRKMAWSTSGHTLP